jgi:hypothetical protein
MERQICAANLWLILVALYFLVSFAIDVVILYKVLFLFDKMGFWSLGFTNLLFGKLKWKMAIGVTGLAVFHFILAVISWRMRVKLIPADKSFTSVNTTEN